MGNVTLKEPDHNKKLIPESPLMRLEAQGDDPEDDGLYPNISGYATLNGAHYYRHENPENPDATVEETLNADGSYKTVEVHADRKGFVSELSHETRSYNSGGHSQQTDGHHDRNVESTDRQNTAGDSGKESGGDVYDGAGGKKIGGSKDDSFENNSGGNTYKTSSGDQITEHTGGQFTSIDGDRVDGIKGNKITMIGEGDYGINVQSGNMDIQIDSGKKRIKAGNDILIESDTKITFKVGGSTIVIEPSKITIVSDRVDINP